MYNKPGPPPIIKTFIERLLPSLLSFIGSYVRHHGRHGTSLMCRWALCLSSVQQDWAATYNQGSYSKARHYTDAINNRQLRHQGRGGITSRCGRPPPPSRRSISLQQFVFNDGRGHTAETDSCYHRLLQSSINSHQVDGLY